MANTESTYEIVDEPTFFEAFFFGQQTTVENKTVKSFTDYGLFQGVGFGLDYRMLFVHIRYIQGVRMDFVSKEGVYVEDTEIRYDAISSPVRYFTVGLGINIHRAIQIDEGHL
jgi:hypothetical protein